MVLEENLPWGIHTGVRPTKLVMDLLEEEYDEFFIRKHLKETYQISDKKIDLCTKIALKEFEILKNIDYKNGYSLYVGIPFCPSICAYCSFSSNPIGKSEELVERYITALLSEIEFAADIYKDRVLNTVYVGGGTPTSVSASQLNTILDKICDCFDFKDVQEFSVEAGRPDSVTKEKLEVIKSHNVDRISINPQTMKQETLDIIGRKHTVEDVEKAYMLARECGFDNINMDLIVGLPGEDKTDIENSLKEIAKFNPESITVHSLAIKRSAGFTLEKEHFEKYNFKNSQDIMDMTYVYAKCMDMEPYYMYRQKKMVGNMENVGYSKRGKEGLYNILMMEEKQSILALGAGAITKVVSHDGKIRRIDNVKSLEHYITRIEEMKGRKREIG